MAAASADSFRVAASFSDSVGPNFRFWALVRQADGTYVAQPFVTVYPTAGLMEIHPVRPGV